MCKWDLHEPDGWTDAVAEFQQERSDEGRTVTLTGQCPRCSDDMSVELAIEERTGRLVDDQKNEEKLDGPFLRIAFCNCVAEHEGRPDDRAGCGAYGALMIG